VRTSGRWFCAGAARWGSFLAAQGGARRPRGVPEPRLRRPSREPGRPRPRPALFEDADVFYNRRRRHSTLGSLSPAAYEAAHQAQTATVVA
jgi:transposase InsO family protein